MDNDRDILLAFFFFSFGWKMTKILVGVSLSKECEQKGLILPDYLPK